ncbi:MAG: hypothetical protein Q8904_06320 [Bacteroidota bacterium]|nr:hypothetical protein [Bacteroidota bacterium]
MKTTFRISVMILVAAFYGCQKSDVSMGVSSSINSDGAFSGTIVNDSNRIDFIKAYNCIVDNQNVIKDSIILGKSAVSSSGKFSVVLTKPILSKIGTSPSGVVVSDTAAMIGYMDGFFAYKGGINTGTVTKGYYNLIDSTKAEFSDSEFLYSDRAFTIIGTETYVSSYNGITYNYTSNNNIIFKKGWNEITYIESYSKTPTTSTTVETNSNTVTSFMQWRYIPNSAPISTINAKTRGVHSIAKPRFLFR